MSLLPIVELETFSTASNGAWDINVEGVGSTLNIIVSSRTPAHSARLKPSHQARVDQYFTDISADIETTSRPAVRLSTH